jgi:hypothetical protein
VRRPSLPRFFNPRVRCSPWACGTWGAVNSDELPARPKDGPALTIRQGVLCKILRDKKVTALDPVVPPGRGSTGTGRGMWVRKWLQHNLLYRSSPLGFAGDLRERTPRSP